MSADLVVDSPAIGWSRAEQLRRAGWRGVLGGGALAALTFAMDVPLDTSWLGWVCMLSLVAAAGSGAVVGLSSWLGATRRPGRLTVTSTDLVVQDAEGHRRVPLTDIADGWVEDPSGIRLRLRDGTVLHAEAPDAPAAEAVLRASGVSVAQRALGMLLTSAASRTFLGVPFATLGAASTGMMTIFLCGSIGYGLADILKRPEGAGLGGMLILLVMLALVATTLLGMVAALWRPRVSIGVDGIAIKSLLGSRFISYAEVTRLEPDPRGVRVVTARGDVLLPTWRCGDAPLAIDVAAGTEASRKQRAIFDRIQRAAALRRPGGPELAVLDRAGRPLEVWRDQVRAMAKERGDYRRVQLDAHDLETIVTDATAPAERRIAAVMALAGEDRPEARQRVRIAIDTCADEELKAALEQAAEDDLDDATMRKALRGV